MRKLSELKPEFLEYDFNYEQSTNYNKKAFEKYNDNVVSIKKTPRWYFVLLKGRNKFFGYKIVPSIKRVLRCYDMKRFAKSKGRVFDKKEFGLFKKGLILEELK